MIEVNRNLDSIQKELTRIANDHEHGSSFLTQQAIHLVIKYVNNHAFSIESLKEEKKALSEFLKDLVQAQPHMASIFSFANQLLFYIDSNETTLSKKSLIQWCQSKFISIETENERIASNSIPLLKKSDTIFTYSSSSAVSTTLFHLKESGVFFQVFCSESRPMQEGITLAKKLGEKQIYTTLMTDASLISHIREADVLILGADAITKNGVMHKIGTYPLIKLAYDLQIPCYVLGSTSKIMPRKYVIDDEQLKPREEITKKHLQNVFVHNLYFDITPLNLISTFITEKGSLSENNVKTVMRNCHIHPLLSEINLK